MTKFALYQTFVAVVEDGSITKAASALNLSVPAISKQLSQLEGSLGVQLFYRSHKKLDITAAGRQFYPKCKAILSSIYQAEEELLLEQETVEGTISITLSKALCRSNIFNIMASFIEIYPLINFDIYFSDDIEDLYEKNIDFAFRLGRLNDSSTMIAKPLIETKLIACATPSYIQKNGRPQSFCSPGKTKFILISSMNPAGELKAFLNREKFDYTQSVAHRTNDIEGVYQLVTSSMGVGIMLDISIQRELAEGKLIPVLSESHLPKKHLHLLSRKEQWQTKKLQLFKDHIYSSLTELSVSNDSGINREK